MVLAVIEVVVEVEDPMALGTVVEVAAVALATEAAEAEVVEEVEVKLEVGAAAVVDDVDDVGAC